MTLVELAAKSRDLRHEMFNLRLQQASAQLEKPARLRILRKDIARLETRISELRTRRNEITGAKYFCMAEETLKIAAARGKRKERVGEVISNKMAKTIVVRVQRRFRTRSSRRLSRLTRNFTPTTKRARPSRATACASSRRGRCRS